MFQFQKLLSKSNKKQNQMFAKHFESKKKDVGLYRYIYHNYGKLSANGPFAIALVCWALCMVRLPGAWICTSHILNIESGCLPKDGW